MRPSINWRAASAALAIVLLTSSQAVAEVMIGRVVGVADGDTVSVLAAGNVQQKVRVAGIDAPEKAQPFGRRARQEMADLVYGKTVSVEWHKRDRYRRAIGKVTVGDRDVGLALIRAGLAWHYKQYESEQSQADREAYATAESDARGSRAGLWSDAAPVPPWNWRRRATVGIEMRAAERGFVQDGTQGIAAGN